MSLLARRRSSLAPQWVICDDFFPNPITGFRVAEFNYYLERHPGLRILSSNPDFPEQHRAYREAYPHHADRIRAYSPDELEGAQLAYLVFLNNAHVFLADLEAAGVPFLFTVYPGGGFAPGTELTEDKVRRVLGSDLARHVITTQSITTDYLRRRNPRNVPITEIFGVVAPANEAVARPAPWPSRPVRVAFVAGRYMPKGENKGYPAFVEAVKRVAPRFETAVFDVVGDYDSTVIDVAELGSRITFHGSLPTSRLRQFLQSTDIVVSPNAPYILEPGNFDGFPTGACIEASLCGATLLATDELGLNQGRFTDGVDFVRIDPTADSVAEELAALLADPARRVSIGQSGRAATKRMFSQQAQIRPREALIRAYLSST